MSMDLSTHPSQVFTIEYSTLERSTVDEVLDMIHDENPGIQYIAVVGGYFGDEAKGKMVDALLRSGRFK